jgi:hypothetical protein
MMAPLVLGVLAVLVALFLGQLFVRADPKALAKALRYVGAALLGAGALALFTVDRVGLGLLLGSMAWGLFTGGHVWPGGWPYYNIGRGRPRPGSSPGPDPQPRGGTQETTHVRTDWLELALDHASGAMRGQVLQGRYKGQALERMSQAALLNLYREAAPQDAETARLLETFIDRTYGSAWRTSSQESKARAETDGGRRRARANGGMSRDEAYAVLGLGPGASADEIRAAHRKLMMQNHPDHGGSGYLAAKINEAKDVLLA